MRVLLLLPLMLLPACSLRVGGSEGLDKVADDLRAENATLRSELEKTRLQLSELTSQLAARPGAARLPALAGISIDGLSGPSRDTREFNVSVATFDGSRRFVPFVGSLKVEILPGESAAEDENGASQAAPLAQRKIESQALAEAYRSSFMGTHYRVDVPLPESARGAKALRIRATAADASTGREFTTEWIWQPAQ
jgi:hypothetical protein